MDISTIQKFKRCTLNSGHLSCSHVAIIKAERYEGDDIDVNDEMYLCKENMRCGYAEDAEITWD